MKRRPLLVLASLGLALTLVGCGGASNVQVQNVDASQFSQVVTEPGVVTIDVRTPAEFAGGHIANAVNIDAEAPDFEQQLQSLDKNVKYAIYCRSGNRSGTAAATMADLGFTSVVNLDGGVIDWTGSGGTLTTS